MATEHDMWTTFNVTWRFVTPLCASVPANPEYIRKWLDARKPATKPPQTKSLEEVAKEVAETTVAPTEDQPPSLLVFQRVDGVLAVRAATIRAHFKDCARVLSSLYSGKIEGQRSFAVRVTNAVYWPMEHYWLPLKAQDGKPLKAGSGLIEVIERPVHAMTPRGPVNALKVFEKVDDAVLEFPIKVLTAANGQLVVSEGDLETLMMYGGTHGYGGERSYDGGRYTFELVRANGRASGSRRPVASESRRTATRAARGHSTVAGSTPSSLKRHRSS